MNSKAHSQLISSKESSILDEEKDFLTAIETFFTSIFA